MKSILGISLAASLALFTPQSAEACQAFRQLSTEDIAFADVIFEGRITDVAVGQKIKGSDRPGVYEFTFDVQDVVRGDLQQDEIVVGWVPKRRSKDSPAFSLEEFTESFGELTRVAISTPELAALFCEPKLRYANVFDEELGQTVTKKLMVPVCNSSARSVQWANSRKIPFVLSQSYECGDPYLFPVAKYEKMQQYHDGVALIEQAEAAGKRVGLKEFHKMVGKYGPLPWEMMGPNAEPVAHILFREEAGFFTTKLKTNLVWQELLIDQGMAMHKAANPKFFAQLNEDEARFLKTRESLRRDILRLANYNHKDPNFRNRLLLDD